MKFGEKIKILRVLKGMTQGDLAEASGLQQSVVGRYEKGAVVPYTAPLLKIAEALNFKEYMKWLQGKANLSFKRSIIYRPMSPFLTYIPATVRSIDIALSTLLPKLTEAMGHEVFKILKSKYGSILVAQGNWDYNSGFTSVIAVVCREEIAPTLEEVFPNAQLYTITDEEMLNVLLFSSLEVVTKYNDLTFLGEYDFELPENNKEGNVNIRLKGAIPITILNDIEQYINNLIVEHGIKAEVTFAGRDEEGLEIEQLVDKKLWKKVSKNFVFNESKSSLLSL